jgi:hypothetical protein
MTPKVTDRGGRTEEDLREYFLRSGYFAVRGIPVEYAGIDVTDVDVWLYLRPSPLGRERINVDVKDRRKPNAMERILFAKGLQDVLGLERAVVATTDKRPAVKTFGDTHGVLVLDGTFLDKLKATAGNSRLTEEEFVEKVISGKEDRLLGNWKVRLDRAKGQLVTSLDFNGCNSWLEEMRYFAEQAMGSSRKEAALRLFYLLESYMLIGLDFSLRALAFEPAATRRQAIENGFRHGSGGKAEIERSLNLATDLVENYLPNARGLGSQLRTRFNADLANLPVEILGEYFGKVEVSSEMFSFARSFESKAYARVLAQPSDLEPPLQGAIGVALDFLGIERQRFFGARHEPLLEGRV